MRSPPSAPARPARSYSTGPPTEGGAVYGTLRDELLATLDEIREAGLYKGELEMTTPQGAHVAIADRGELLNLCANNYLGLASHPAIVAAAHDALDRWGYGMA